MARSFARPLSVVAVVAVAASAAVFNLAPASAVPVGFTVDQNTGQLASVDAGASTLTDIGGEVRLIDSLALACDGDLLGIEKPIEEGDSAKLVKINPATGVPTSIGALGLESTEYGMAFAPDGTLWLSTGDTLYRANVATGATTPVGSFVDGATEMNSLAFNAAGTLYGYDETRGRLFTIDLATAAETEVGSSKYSMGSVHGLDFDSAGTLWAIAQTDGIGMAVFDLTTGDGSFPMSNAPVNGQGLALTALPCSTPETTTSTSTTSTTSTTVPRGATPTAVQPRFAG